MHIVELRTRCRSRNSRWAFHFSGAGPLSWSAAEVGASMSLPEPRPSFHNGVRLHVGTKRRLLH